MARCGAIACSTGLTRLLNAPGLFFYGFVGNLTNYPHNTIPMFVGALLGRYYFAKVVGRERWQMYAPVLLAGYSCGMGLIGMCAIALALISKTVSCTCPSRSLQAPYRSVLGGLDLVDVPVTTVRAGPNVRVEMKGTNG